MRISDWSSDVFSSDLSNVGWNVARRGRMCGRRVATLGLSSGRTIEDRSVIGAIVGRSTVRRSATRAMTGVTTGSPGPTGTKAGRTIVRHHAIVRTLVRKTVGIGETMALMSGANTAPVTTTIPWSRTAGTNSLPGIRTGTTKSISRRKRGDERV